MSRVEPAHGLPRGGARLGTFGGVFTPSILTILGLILFLRLGFVVGEGGLRQALLLLALASTISILTTTSLSAIATNRRVRAGGDYFLISRSLGVDYGAALGLLLFLAQSVSVAFYCLGFAEAMSALLPTLSPRAGAFTAWTLLLILAWLGADLATRFQYVILATLAAALVSFLLGGDTSFSGALLRESLEPAEGSPGFWILFGIFFPAVTGFTQGVSMSGDLEDPARSLPAGTFAAVGLSIAVYGVAMLLLAGRADRAALLGDPMVMRSVAAVPALVDAGVLAATISSALASFLGAPRILQALAADRVFPVLARFAATAGPTRNPRRAVLLTGAIAAGTILAGSLDAIAALVSMFFLISYGLLNYATYVEATIQTPSFRPRFRLFHRHASLAGTLLAVAAMLAIRPVFALAAAAILVAIHQYVRRTAVPVPWRDARRAYRFHRIKESLREVADEPEDPRDWQPHILAFTEGEARREHLLQFASWLAGGTGFITAVQIVRGEPGHEATRAAVAEAEKALRGEIEAQHLDAFPLALGAADVRIAAGVLVQSWGVGPIRANTVLLNWLGPSLAREATAELWYARVLRTAIRLGRSVVVLNGTDRSWERCLATSASDRRIDVWWSADDSARLALLFAHLATRSSEWEEARIRVLVPARERDPEKVSADMARRLEEIRIDAEVLVLAAADRAGLAESTAGSSLVLLPLVVAGMQIHGPFGEPIGDLLDGLPLTALVGAASDVMLVEGEEEETPAAPPESASAAAAPSEPPQEPLTEDPQGGSRSRESS